MLVAHAKWFTPTTGGYPVDLGFAFEGRTLLALAVAAALTAGWPRAARWLRLDAPRLAPPAEIGRRLPRVVAGAAGASLVALAATGALLAPQHALPPTLGGTLLRVAELGTGGWLLSGRRLRGAALAVGTLSLLTGLLHGPTAVLESAHLIGVAGYLWLRDRDGETALRALGTGVGIALVTVALTEKLTAPLLSAAVLAEHPAVDPALLGVALDPFDTVRALGAVEVLLGLLVLSGAGRRALAVAAVLPFLATLPVFGVVELVGHLPLYGAFAVLALDLPAGAGAAVGAAGLPAAPGGHLSETRVTGWRSKSVLFDAAVGAYRRWPSRSTRDAPSSCGPWSSAA